MTTHQRSSSSRPGNFLFGLTLSPSPQPGKLLLFFGPISRTSRSAWSASPSGSRPTMGLPRFSLPRAGPFSTSMKSKLPPSVAERLSNRHQIALTDLDSNSIGMKASVLHAYCCLSLGAPRAEFANLGAMRGYFCRPPSGGRQIYTDTGGKKTRCGVPPIRRETMRLDDDSAWHRDRLLPARLRVILLLVRIARDVWFERLPVEAFRTPVLFAIRDTC